MRKRGTQTNWDCFVDSCRTKFWQSHNWYTVHFVWSGNVVFLKGWRSQKFFDPEAFQLFKHLLLPLSKRFPIWESSAVMNDYLTLTNAFLKREPLSRNLYKLLLRRLWLRKKRISLTKTINHRDFSDGIFFSHASVAFCFKQKLQFWFSVRNNFERRQ